jgi:hypothetical protein
MSNAIRTVSPPASQALSHLSIFGPPPLLKGDDAAAYDDLLARVSGNVKPSDIFEEIWVREIVDLMWENWRWRRYLTNLLESAAQKRLGPILQKILQNRAKPRSSSGSAMSKLRAAEMSLNGGEKLASLSAAGNKNAIECVEELLLSAGMTMDSVVAQASAGELDKIERFNRLIASTEWRCNALLREIDRHRASIAQKRHCEVRKIQDAEFETVEANPVAPTRN